jgi:hypothetical protein
VNGECLSDRVDRGDGVGNDWVVNSLHFIAFFDLYLRRPNLLFIISDLIAKVLDPSDPGSVAYRAAVAISAVS